MARGGHRHPLGAQAENDEIQTSVGTSGNNAAEAAKRTCANCVAVTIIPQPNSSY